jgi:hypothetical protein
MADVKVSALTALTGANLANGDQFLVTDVGSPNVSKSITADELAQGSQFSSRYKPLASDRLWISAAQMIAVQGSPSLSNFGGYYVPSWALDASTDERVAFSMFMPVGWNTMTAKVWMANAAASNAGNVVLDLTWYGLGIGDSWDAGSTNTGNQTVAIGANFNVVQWNAGAISLTSYTTTDMFRFSLVRNADDAGDTMGNDLGIYGVLFERAS